MVAEAIGWFVTVTAVAGAVLNMCRRREGFYVWIASNAASGGLHLAAGMIALTVRDAVFLSICIGGLVFWRKRR